MLVRCIKNNINDIKEHSKLFDNLKKSFGEEHDGKLRIEVGKTYVVYGVEIIEEYPWYHICVEEGILYPWPYAAPFFEIIDNRLSRYWFFGYSVRNNKEEKEEFVSEIYTEISFKEWIEQNDFAGRLLDGSEREISLFQKYKRLMDVEFVNPEVSRTALVLLDSWIQCTVCDESWEATKENEMLRCPKCSTILINPLVTVQGYNIGNQ